MPEMVINADMHYSLYASVLYAPTWSGTYSLSHKKYIKWVLCCGFSSPFFTNKTWDSEIGVNWEGHMVRSCFPCLSVDVSTLDVKIKIMAIVIISHEIYMTGIGWYSFHQNNAYWWGMNGLFSRITVWTLVILSSNSAYTLVTARLMGSPCSPLPWNQISLGTPGIKPSDLVMFQNTRDNDIPLNSDLFCWNRLLYLLLNTFM